MADSLTIDRDDDDPYIPLDDAPRHIPGRPHRATVWRWTSHGTVRNGQTIRLRSILSGGRRWTRLDWINDYLQALNADSLPPTSTQAAVASRRKSQAESAMAALATR